MILAKYSNMRLPIQGLTHQRLRCFLFHFRRRRSNAKMTNDFLERLVIGLAKTTSNEKVLVPSLFLDGMSYLKVFACAEWSPNYNRETIVQRC